MQGTALLYCRVSTREQSMHGFSVADQVAKLTAEAERRGMALEIFTDDRTAKDTNRPVLQTILARLADPKDPAKALLATRLDRVSRSTADFYLLMDRAAREGWSLVCLEPQVDMTTPFGRAMAGIAAVFAQLERELIAQRQRDSVAYRKANGIYRNNVPEVPRQLDVSVCRMRAGGLMWRQISDQLLAEGHAPPRGGDKWHHTVLERMAERGAQ